MTIIPVVFVVLFWFFPESPQQLLKNKQHLEAEKALRFYRNIDEKDAQLNSELQSEFEKFKSIAQQNESNPPLKLADFRKYFILYYYSNTFLYCFLLFLKYKTVTPAALRAMSICPFLMAVNQFSGAFAISNYAETIFKQTGSTIDPQISAIVFAAIQVVGTYIAAQLMDKVGRKVLLLVSLTGGIVALLITGSYAYLVQCGYDMTALNWIPLVSLSCFIFTTSIGMLPAPYVMLAEVIPQKVSTAQTFTRFV